MIAVGAEQPAIGEASIGSLTLRELARQSVLIAARDGLGAATRDQTLREPFPDGAVVLDVSIKEFGGAKDTMHVRVTKRGKDGVAPAVVPPNGAAPADPAAAAGGAEPTIVFEGDAAVPPVGSWYDLVTPAKTFEQCSRKDLVDALAKAGVASADGRAVAGPASAPAASAPTSSAPATAPALAADAPDGLDNATLDLASLFLTVRRAHATLDARPGDAAALRTLVRGYAHLAGETRFLWAGTAHAFWARGLLYAERMVAADPAAAAPLYYRA